MSVPDCCLKGKLKETARRNVAPRGKHSSPVFSEPIIKRSKDHTASKKVRDMNQRPWERRTSKPEYWKDFNNRMRALKWFGANVKRKGLPFTLYELHSHNLGTLADYYGKNIYMIQEELARCHTQHSTPPITKRS